jgi:hypothetical protein
MRDAGIRAARIPHGGKTLLPHPATLILHPHLTLPALPPNRTPLPHLE